MGKDKPKGNTAEQVRRMAEPLAEELGLSLWDVVFLKEGADWFLRIYIDRDDTGVSIDDCVSMTRAIDPLLDETDLIQQEYTLEVSSPGINRRLTKPRHLKKFVDCPVRVRLIRPLEDGRRELEGILLRAEDDGTFEVKLDEASSAVFEKKECASVILLDDIQLEEDID